MPEADKLRLFCFSFQRARSFSHMSLDTSFGSTSAGLSALCTFSSRNLSAAIHDRIANNRTPRCFRRPAPVRFANCNAEEMSPYTTGGFFAKPCPTIHACISSTSTAALAMEFSSASRILKAYDAWVRDQLETQHPAKSSTPPVADLRSAIPAQSACTTAVSTKRPFEKRSSVILRVADRIRMRGFRAMRSETRDRGCRRVCHELSFRVLQVGLQHREKQQAAHLCSEKRVLLLLQRGFCALNGVDQMTRVSIQQRSYALRYSDSIRVAGVGVRVLRGCRAEWRWNTWNTQEWRGVMMEMSFLRMRAEDVSPVGLWPTCPYVHVKCVTLGRLTRLRKMCVRWGVLCTPLVAYKAIAFLCKRKTCEEEDEEEEERRRGRHSVAYLPLSVSPQALRPWRRRGRSCWEVSSPGLA